MRRNAPYSLRAAAKEFWRPEAESFPTSSDAVACPNFNDPANRNRSSQCSAINSMFSFRVINGPVRGNRASTSVRGPGRAGPGR